MKKFLHSCLCLVAANLAALSTHSSSLNEETRLIDGMGESVSLTPIILSPRNVLSPPAHPMSYHYYHSGTCHIDERLIAELYYDGDLPILAMHSTDPEECGRALGDLLFNAIVEFDHVYGPPFKIALRASSRILTEPEAHITDTITSWDFYYPDWCMGELRGICEVYNELLEEVNETHRLKIKTVNLEHLRAITTATDVYKGVGRIACSAALRRDSSGEIELYRNLDWGSLGILGRCTLLIVRRLDNAGDSGPRATLSVAIPPGHFAISMLNDRGLFITLNEVSTMQNKRHAVGGMPEGLLIRDIVRSCTTLEEVIAYLEEQPAASPHSLTVRDAHGNGAIIQILPAESREPFTVRPLESQDWIAVTNHHYDQGGELIDGSQSSKSSEFRYEALAQALLEGRSGQEALVAANAPDTLHAMTYSYNPNTGKMELYLSIDNRDAAEGPYHRVDYQALFDRILETHTDLPGDLNGMPSRV